MTNEDKQNVAATILGAIILIGAFYVVVLGIETIAMGLRGIAMAILTTK